MYCVKSFGLQNLRRFLSFIGLIDNSVNEITNSFKTLIFHILVSYFNDFLLSVLPGDRRQGPRSAAPGAGLRGAAGEQGPGDTGIGAAGGHRVQGRSGGGKLMIVL